MRVDLGHDIFSLKYFGLPSAVGRALLAFRVSGRRRPRTRATWLSTFMTCGNWAPDVHPHGR